MSVTVLFDSILKTRSGKHLPYYDCSYVEEDGVSDNSLHWFHEGYGTMCLYRLWKVDEKNYIAESMHKYCGTNSAKWDIYVKNPELALSDK